MTGGGRWGAYELNEDDTLSNEGGLHAFDDVGMHWHLTIPTLRHLSLANDIIREAAKATRALHGALSTSRCQLLKE